MALVPERKRMALENPNIVSEQAIETVNSVLPDCIISYIFSKLDNKKDMAKTSILSKRWLHEWQSRMDLNFDIYYMFDHAQLASRYSFEKVVQNFTRIVDQFIMNYQGSEIRSIRLRLGFQNKDVIDRLTYDQYELLKGGVERIELLLSKCDSLKYIHLLQCVKLKMDISKFKNLQTLVLQQIIVEQGMLLGLFSNSIHLVKLTLKECNFKSDINIVSPKLCHLEIIDRYLHWSHPFKITVDAVNLSSFEYSCGLRLSSIEAPGLRKFFWGAIQHQKMPSPSDLIASLHQLENLVLSTNHSHVARLLKNLGSFQNVRQLEIFIFAEIDENMGYLQILRLVMAFPNLQKLVLTIRRQHLEDPNWVTYRREKREYAGFFHNQLKYVDLQGCIGPTNAYELANHLLKKVNSLKQITFSPRGGRLYIGAGKWREGFDCPNCLECDLVREILKDEVNEQCRLVIL